MSEKSIHPFKSSADQSIKLRRKRNVVDSATSNRCFESAYDKIPLLLQQIHAFPPSAKFDRLHFGSATPLPPPPVVRKKNTELLLHSYTPTRVS
jgi:hypothetical protein